ncbi:MAG: tRNA (adenosine(37)-N6)-threonylcarbamoyltransferase complex ATPase subunit type 1 TsaE [Clostridia bacterium]|nr:tRNA (adenosine(37)-N6)-threonylcarbamoyltransferase complex ATPase subunit type 1 TsaE [Clostridia bacterium]
MEFPYGITTNSPEETESVGELLATAIKNSPDLPRFVAMFGDLGVGKTAFVRGFTRVYAPEAAVKSPTFALVNQYGRRPSAIYHFDMYRITDEDDLYSTGFYDYLSGEDICIAEWCENIPYAIPERYLRVSIEKTSFDAENERRISITLI